MLRPSPCALLVRSSVVALAACFVVLVLCVAPAPRLIPLDLPMEMPRAEAQTAPGQVEFYDQFYSGDSFVWCLDISCSMGWDSSFISMQSEVSEALAQLTPNQQFSIVIFSDAYVAYSLDLLTASAANVADATAWLNGTTTSGTTCPLPPLVASLGILQGATAGEPLLFHVTDSLPSCNTPAATIDGVTMANPTQIPLHVIGVGSPDAVETQYLQSLAMANGGSYLDADSISPPIRRADANGDGWIDIADAITLLAVTFGGGTSPICEDAADANDDGLLQGIPDAITILSHLFVTGSPTLPAPFPDCGFDPTPDVLPCVVTACP